MHVLSVALPMALSWFWGNLCTVVGFLFNVVWELTNSEGRKKSEKRQNVAMLVCEAVSL